MFLKYSASTLVCGIIASSLGIAQSVPMSDAERSVVQLVVSQQDGSTKAVGTAFFVRDDGTLATANHVYADAVNLVASKRQGTIQIRRFVRESTNGLLCLVDLVSTDVMHDLAVLKIRKFSADDWKPFGGVKIVTISTKSELPNATHVYFVGYFGDDMLPTTVPAALSGTAPIPIGQGPNTTIVEDLLVSGSALPGHSGSPIFLEDTLEVIGIVNSMITAPLPTNPPQWAHAGLTRVSKGEHLIPLLSAEK